MQWCRKRSHLFALADDVFLIAAFVGGQHNFFRGLLGAADVGDVKEVRRIIDQLPLTSRHRHLLVKYDHTVRLVAFAWRISKLGDKLFLQPLVLVLLFDDHLLFGIGATSSRAFRYPLLSMKLLPHCVIEVFSHFDQFLIRIEAEHKLYIVVMPSIEMARLRKVRVAFHQDLSKARATAQINAAVEEDVGTFVRRSIAWSVPQIK